MNPVIGSHILQRLQQTVGNKWSSLGVPQVWSSATTAPGRPPSITLSLGPKGRAASSASLDTESTDKGDEGETSEKRPKKAKSTKKNTKLQLDNGGDKEGEAKKKKNGEKDQSEEKS